MGARGILVRAGLAAALMIAAPDLAEPAVRDGQAIAVDGIAAVVTGEVITLGEVVRAALLRAERPDDGAGIPGGCGPLAGAAASVPVAGASDSEAAVPGGSDDQTRRPDTDQLAASLECLIDARLVYREVRRFPQLDPAPALIEAQFQALADSFGDPAAFAAELRRLALTPGGVRSDLRRQHLVAAYIDSRFRATIDVTREEIQRYYEEELVPELSREGIDLPPLEAVAEGFIAPILREREVNRRVQSWISDLRERATIQRRMQ